MREQKARNLPSFEKDDSRTRVRSFATTTTDRTIPQEACKEYRTTVKIWNYTFHFFVLFRFVLILLLDALLVENPGLRREKCAHIYHFFGHDLLRRADPV